MRRTALEKLSIWSDGVPRDPALQMAVDEVMLGRVREEAVLRHYLWEGQCASFGVFQSLAVARAEAPGFSLVRRWTGGGVVRHDADWTFSLILPRGCGLASERASVAYCAIHSAVAHALGRLGVEARPTSKDDVRVGASCFAAPVEGDLIAGAGVKICGGAQRRTRHGVLHQGSVQGVPLGQNFIEELARAFSSQVGPWVEDGELLAEARALATQKYATSDWLGRVA